MSADEIRVDYEQLDMIAARFGREGDATEQSARRLRQRMERLAQSWRGRGSSAFFAEMEGDVLPALDRLTAALDAAQRATIEIARLFREAEEEAAAPFKGTGSGANGAPAGGSGEPAESAGPPFGDYNNLANSPPLVLGPGATHQDVAAALEQMYRKEGGIDEPIRIIRTGEDQYLVLIAGTDTGDESTGGNDWWANAGTGRGIPSAYMQEVQEKIAQVVPKGATVHLAGHSQGGHVAMAVAGDQDFVDKYPIGSVSTYGSSGNVPVNPRVGADRYHSFLLNGDPIGAIQMHGQGNVFSSLVRVVAPPGSGLRAIFGGFGVAGVGGPTIVPQVVMDPGSHGDYHHSPYLASRPTPFTIERWEVVGSFEATQRDNLSLAAGRIGEGWARRDPIGLAGGVLDFGTHFGATTVVAGTQNFSTGITQFMPGSWQVAVDRQFDRAGHLVTDLPPPTRLIEMGWDALFGD